MEKPICIAVNLCNQVIHDSRTGQNSLIGCIIQLAAFQLPVTHPEMHICVSLTNINGRVPLKVTLRSPSNHVVFAAELVSDCNDPLAVHELDVCIGALQLKEFGTYYADVTYEGEFLGSRRFNLLQAQAKAA